MAEPSTTGRELRGARRVAALAATACLSLAATSPCTLADKPAGSWGRGVLHAFVGGVEMPRDVEARIVVDQAVGEIDAAEITLFGPRGSDFAEAVRLEDDLRVDARNGSVSGSVFKGEIVAIEPVFDRDGGSRVVLRGFDRLHRLTRGRKTRTFADVTDADLVRVVAEENGLVAGPTGDLDERYDEVVQHNQTDLEFLRVRAARIGYEVFVDDRTLVFARRVEPTPVVVAPDRPDGEARLHAFHPRLSSSSTVQKVTVRGWDPDRKKEIVGTATARTILLVPGADDPGLVFGLHVEVLVDVPLTSQGEADALAQAELARRHEGSISAEAACGGDADLRAGATVVVAGAGARFDGTYYVTGVSHRFSHPSGSGGGYRTLLRLRRADGALFRIPEIDDEVLVAFEHGDPDRPIIVGSLWDEDDDPPPSDRR